MMNRVYMSLSGKSARIYQVNSSHYPSTHNTIEIDEINAEGLNVLIFNDSEVQKFRKNVELLSL